MTTPLAPTVRGPILTCSTHVLVSGALVTADVELRSGGDQVGLERATFNGDLWIKLVRRLEEGETITTLQSVDGVPSERSAIGVPVIGVPLPLPAPVFASPVSKCMNNVLLSALVPGATVELKAGSTIIASVIAQGTSQWVGFDPSSVASASFLTARQSVDAEVSPVQNSPTLRFPAVETLEPPKFLSPLAACDTGALVGGLVPAGEMVIEQAISQVWISIAETFWATGMRPLEQGKLHTLQRLPGCRIESDPIEVEVGPATQPLAPIVYPFCPELRRIRIDGLKPGGVLTLWKRQHGTAIEVEIGSIGIGRSGEDIDLPEIIGGIGPLMEIVARQTNCSLTSPAGSALEFARPDVPGIVIAGPPTITKPLLACSMGVPATGLYHGAQPYSLRTGLPLGDIVTAPTSASVLPTWLPLKEDDEVEIRQFGCAAPAPSQSERVQSLPNEMPAPTVVEPLKPLDTRVTVKGVLPGARVQLLVDQVERSLSGPVFGGSVTLHFAPPLKLDQLVWATQSLCTKTSTREGRFARVRKGKLDVAVSPGSVVAGETVAVTVSATDAISDVAVPGLQVLLDGSSVGTTGLSFVWPAPGAAGSVAGVVKGGDAYDDAAFSVPIIVTQPASVAVTLNLFPGPQVVPGQVWQESVVWTLVPGWGAAPVKLNANVGTALVPAPPAGGVVAVQLAVTAHIEGLIGGVVWPPESISFAGTLTKLALVHATHSVAAHFEATTKEVLIIDQNGVVTGSEIRPWVQATLFSIT